MCIRDRKNINPILLDMRDLDKMCKGLHQGIILEVEDVKTYSLEDIIPNIDKEYPLVVLLDHIEDPHNFGAIIRSCEAFGVDAIIIPNDRSVDKMCIRDSNKRIRRLFHINK